MLLVLTLQITVVRVVTLSMMIRIALVFISGFSNQTHAWAVDDCIDNHANYAQQETARRTFLHRI